MEKLSNPQVTIQTIKKYEFAFQKKFGQNFLIDDHVITKIINAAEITKDDLVLEIGPGIGTMTQYLAESARKVIAVEIDKNLIPILGETLAEYDNVTVINEDISTGWWRKKMQASRSRSLPICHIILQLRSLWAYLKVMYHYSQLRSWYRRK
mgnify:CR=1 FL=1